MKLFASVWEHNSGGILRGSSVLFAETEFHLVLKTLLTSIFSLFIGCNVPHMVFSWDVNCIIFFVKKRYVQQFWVFVMYLMVNCKGNKA